MRKELRTLDASSGWVVSSREGFLPTLAGRKQDEAQENGVEDRHHSTVGLSYNPDANKCYRSSLILALAWMFMILLQADNRKGDSVFSGYIQPHFLLRMHLTHPAASSLGGKNVPSDRHVKNLWLSPAGCSEERSHQGYKGLHFYLACVLEAFLPGLSLRNTEMTFSIINIFF